MKTRAILSLIAAALAAGAVTAGAEQPAAPAPTPIGNVKWHPGHYALVQSSPLSESHLYKHFQGIQKFYDWKTLEPEKDRYDFSAIRSDLAFLGKHGKRLVIQVQTKAFGGGQNCCPAYLSGLDYGGGVYKTRLGSLNPIIWDVRVNRRLNALYQQLGKELDREPYLEALVIPETAITGDVAAQAETRYTPEIYTRSVEAGMQAMKDAFPHTVIIQYVNMPLETIQPLATYAKAHGIGFGGPEIYPFDLVLNDRTKGTYHLYPQLSGIVPLAAAVQQNNYSYKEALGAPPGEGTVRAIYEFGRGKLCLNYIFWSIRHDYFERVRAMMDDPAFPKDSAGGLNTTFPKTIKPLTGEGK